MRKVYIKYSRPFKYEDDEPPIEEIWSDGDRPKKKLADSLTLYVYDVQVLEGKYLLQNERLWGGIE